MSVLPDIFSSLHSSRKRLEQYEKYAREYLKSTYVSDQSVLKPISIQFSFDDDSIPEQKHTRKSDNYNDIFIDRIMTELQEKQEVNPPLELHLNQTFSEKLLDLIDGKGKHDVQIYKAAQMDRRLFSKIISNKNYRPAKDTVFAFIFALQLDGTEAKDLLERAGYTLSHSTKRDVIIEYFIRDRIYNLNHVNEILYRLGENKIGR